MLGNTRIFNFKNFWFNLITKSETRIFEVFTFNQSTLFMVDKNDQMASSIDMVYYDGIQQEIGFSVKALELSLQWNALIVAQENVCFPVAFCRKMSYKPIKVGHLVSKLSWKLLITLPSKIGDQKY